MLNYAAQTYQKTSQQTVEPRRLEANLFLNAARKLQKAKDNWDAQANTLLEAIKYNRKLWIVLSSAVTEEGREIDPQLKDNFAALSVYVLKRLITVEANPAPEKLDILISINKDMAAGLTTT